MDQGAHFHRCDFQVHTPRDANWVGERPYTDSERRLYADGFVVACRERGLNAVAITDHHDFELVPYLRDAAAREIGQDGDLLPSHEQLVVFPGLELTLGVPCQAILILDADFPNDKLGVVLDALAVTKVEPDAKHLGAVQRLDHIDSLQTLYDELDKHSWLQGAYIALPNVTDGGYQTLMRSGMQSKYKEMPCPGGYLDGSVQKIGTGNQRIFAGLDQNWGHKTIALFQTSDSRSDDYSQLAKHTTWVKWASPTAEALRQACLAKESRISHDEPELPNACITRMSVSNSTFMGPIELEYNRQYNAIIGGRGTGKSTCLEYLRWALCDEAASSEAIDEMPDHAKRRERLIADTLAPIDAHIDVYFTVNQLPHLVRRYAKNGEVAIRIGDGELRQAMPSDVRSLLPVVAYSQKQLSSVAVRLDELYRFVTAPIARQLDGIDSDIDDQATLIRANYATLLRYRSLEANIAREDLNIASLASQADGLRKSMSAISEDDQAIIAAKSGFDSARQEVAALDRSLDRMSDAVGSVDSSLRTIQIDTSKEESTSGALQVELSNMQQEVGSLVAQLKQATSAMLERIEALQTDGSSYHIARSNAEHTISEFEVEYEAATDRSSAHASQLQELRLVEQRHQDSVSSVASLRDEIDTLDDPATEHEVLRQHWLRLQEQRSTTISQQCQELGRLSGGTIRANVMIGSGLRAIVDRLRTAVQGSGVRQAKIAHAVEELIDSDDALLAWESVLRELEAAIASVEIAEQPPTPNLTAIGFSAADIQKIASKLTPESWLDLALAVTPDQPYFEYMSKDGEYFDFAVASAGQQATALLSVLLAQEGPPLIIDQPEDDLDSQVIVDVVERLWKAKKTRQLIFASHNANLVVNGDAELVVSCDYRAAGDHSGGRLKLQGAIDVNEMREEITQVMEGGEKAFRLRKDKYGF
ncbi:TrlF family AAA-like ATPase [Candidatus Poriferisodalis sp.]|uniref:TrlF family AAA-like ATPase n=1 Tax=Candidatus Poriferisodalis sp. TaxID=3101277 RepID=UPI003B021166